MSLIRPHYWLQGKKPLLEARRSIDGSNACQTILVNRLPKLRCYPRVKGASHELATPFFSEPGFHAAVEQIGTWLAAHNARNPKLNAFWVEMTVYQDPSIFLIETGVMPCQPMQTKLA